MSLFARSIASLRPSMYGWISSGRSNDNLIDNLRLNVGLSEQVASSMKKVDRANYCRDADAAYIDSPQVCVLLP